MWWKGLIFSSFHRPPSFFSCRCEDRWSVVSVTGPVAIRTRAACYNTFIFIYKACRFTSEWVQKFHDWGVFLCNCVNVVYLRMFWMSRCHLVCISVKIFMSYAVGIKDTARFLFYRLGKSCCFTASSPHTLSFWNMFILYDLHNHYKQNHIC